MERGPLRCELESLDFHTQLSVEDFSMPRDSRCGRAVNDYVVARAAAHAPHSPPPGPDLMRVLIFIVGASGFGMKGT
jgi:hypothetical protein